MTILTREQILAAKSARQSEPVTVPEWGGDVIVRELSAEESMEAGGAADNLGATYSALLRSIVDAAGARLFSDADAEFIRNLSARTFNRLVAVMNRLNGVSAEGNASTPSGDLPSA